MKQRKQKMKLYLVRHAERGEIAVNGRNRYEAALAAARQWGVPWTSIARECEYAVLAEEGEIEHGHADKA